MFAVIFKAQIRELDHTYHETAARLRELAMGQYGCVEFMSFTEGDQEISISYWKTQTQIDLWRKNAAHLETQALGKSKWYKSYHIEVVQVIRQYRYPTSPESVT